MPQPRKYNSHAERQAAYQRRRQEALQRQLQEKGLPAGPPLPAMPGTARWQCAIQKAVLFLATVAQEMESYYDDRSDAWRESDRGDVFQARLEAVQEAKSVVEDLLIA